MAAGLARATALIAARNQHSPSPPWFTSLGSTSVASPSPRMKGSPCTGPNGWPSDGLGMAGASLLPQHRNEVRSDGHALAGARGVGEQHPQHALARRRERAARFRSVDNEPPTSGLIRLDFERIHMDVRRESKRVSAHDSNSACEKSWERSRLTAPNKGVRDALSGCRIARCSAAERADLQDPRRTCR